MPDYNYHTSPETLNTVLAQIGGVSALLTFCQTHHVQVYMGADYSYNCWIDDATGCYSCDMDAFSAMVLGVANWGKENNPRPGASGRKEVAG